MQKTHDLIAAGRKYKDRNGDEKTHWVQCGSIFRKDNGAMYIKLDAIPTGNEWSGWLTVKPFDPKSRKESPRHQQQSQPATDNADFF